MKKEISDDAVAFVLQLLVYGFRAKTSLMAHLEANVEDVLPVAQKWFYEVVMLPNAHKLAV